MVHNHNPMFRELLRDEPEGAQSGDPSVRFGLSIGTVVGALIILASVAMGSVGLLLVGILITVVLALVLFGPYEDLDGPSPLGRTLRTYPGPLSHSRPPVAPAPPPPSYVPPYASPMPYQAPRSFEQHQTYVAPPVPAPTWNIDLEGPVPTSLDPTPGRCHACGGVLHYGRLYCPHCSTKVFQTDPGTPMDPEF